MDRPVREVRSALHRRKREEGSARRALAQQRHHEMRETLTAMLLLMNLALSVPDVPGPAGGENTRHQQPRAGTAAPTAGQLTVCSFSHGRSVCRDALHFFNRKRLVFAEPLDPTHPALAHSLVPINVGVCGRARGRLCVCRVALRPRKTHFTSRHKTPCRRPARSIFPLLCASTLSANVSLLIPSMHWGF